MILSYAIPLAFGGVGAYFMSKSLLDPVPIPAILPHENGPLPAPLPHENGPLPAPIPAILPHENGPAQNTTTTAIYPPMYPPPAPAYNPPPAPAYNPPPLKTSWTGEIPMAKPLWQEDVLAPLTTFVQPPPQRKSVPWSEPESTLPPPESRRSTLPPRPEPQERTLAELQSTSLPTPESRRSTLLSGPLPTLESRRNTLLPPLSGPRRSTQELPSPGLRRNTMLSEPNPEEEEELPNTSTLHEDAESSSDSEEELPNTSTLHEDAESESDSEEEKTDWISLESMNAKHRDMNSANAIGFEDLMDDGAGVFPPGEREATTQVQRAWEARTQAPRPPPITIPIRNVDVEADARSAISQAEDALARARALRESNTEQR